MILVENNSKLYYFETGRYNHNSWKSKESKLAELVALLLLVTPGAVIPFLRELKTPPVTKMYLVMQNLQYICE